MSGAWGASCSLQGLLAGSSVVDGPRHTDDLCQARAYGG